MSKTILIIDQDRLSAAYLKELLLDEGIKVLLAHEEKDALNFLNQHEVDTVIMEPLMGSDYLVDKKASCEDPHIGGVGFIIFNNIKKIHTEPRFIILSNVSQSNLMQVGFPKELRYFRKPERIHSIVTEINN